MQQFACGDVVPGGDAVFGGIDDAAILTEVARHAVADHGLVEVSDELAAAVTAAIQPVTAAVG